ncbi:hypothetical protein HPB47_022557 [Ixodes persulcatus]|uniref:Uncharacterized protein n=1 Tax=Ixodes persulcatus TaxID=34615 RepID=A0AC60QAG8_IXOPE|nr:hypothetical protein HPB47_022557 [Ixodes persulcatus]
MVVCQACGGETFEEVSGLYYCSECNTQSQEVRLEEVDDAFTANVTYGRSSSRSPSRSPRSDDSGDEGAPTKRPYPTNELFNIILVRQVNALVSLGASAKLRTTVCSLWMRYLVKVEALSQNDDGSVDEFVPRVSVVNRWSDLRTVEEMMSAGAEDTQRRKVRKALFSSGVRTRLLSRPLRDTLKQKVRSAPRKKQNLDSDYETVSEGEDSDQELDLVSGVARDYLERATERGEDIHSKKLTREAVNLLVTMRKLVCFLYLGVLLNRDPILLSDILRWISDGHVPYLNAVRLLPPDVRLWGAQWGCFVRQLPPLAETVAWETAYLAEFLGVKQELTPPDVLPVLGRLLVDLNLPLGLLDVCRRVLAVFPNLELQWHWSREGSEAPVCLQPSCEVRAVAILLLVLKLVFLLDGKREKRVSSDAEKLQEPCPGRRLFCWSQWEEHTRARILLLRSNCYLFEPDDVDMVRSVVPLLREPREPLSKTSPVAMALREGLQKAFREMHGQNLAWEQVPPSSFALTTAVDFFAQRPEVSPGLKQELDEEFLHRDVTYLTRDRGVLAELGEWNDLIRRHPELGRVARGRCQHYWIMHPPPQRKAKYRCVRHRLPSDFVWLLEFLATVVHCEAGKLYADLVSLEKKSIIRRRS